MLAILCDSNGNRQCGSDNFVPIDSRLTINGRLKKARGYRTRFRANFPHKYDHWTHCFFVPSIRAWDGNPGKRLYAL